jgi:small multidrug resistance family-3 protein
MTTTAGVYVAATVAEIAGCFAFWAWLRLGKTARLGGPRRAWLVWCFSLGSSPALTATSRDAPMPPYGGVYIAASLLWLWLAEAQRPDRWDLIGATICLVGAAAILWGPRAT